MVGACKKKLVITERRIKFYAEHMEERDDFEKLRVNGRTIGNVLKEIYEYYVCVSVQHNSILYKEPT